DSQPTLSVPPPGARRPRQSLLELATAPTVPPWAVASTVAARPRCGLNREIECEFSGSEVKPVRVTDSRLHRPPHRSVSPGAIPGASAGCETRLPLWYPGRPFVAQSAWNPKGRGIHGRSEERRVGKLVRTT